MASSSTSFTHKSSFKYDVFLSFRGEDTRTNFVDHLYHALKLESIETYKDDENLERGKKISKELIQAIGDSRVHVIIFSKNYASSSWCLDELVKIMECQKTTTGHTVYPIFYHVEPTEVRKQSGEFGKAFTKHEKAEAAQKWREAMVEATSFSGQELTADRHEVEFIKTVVKEISLKLPFISADENLIGMRTRINGVVSSLNAFPDQFCMIGIWGMGGSGKTTLARAVFDQISFQFEGKSFVANVREVSKPSFSGLKKLQQQVLRDVSNDQGITVNDVFDGKDKMKRKMPGRMVLIVLDDVDHIDQLKALAGEPNWFKPGSKIIITTRDKQVLLAHKVNSIHDVNLLTDEEAICLLSRCAFGTEIPNPGYKELSRKIVSYAAGLPLTITILGSSLCDANEHIWIDTLKELETIPLDGTLQRLELSYKGLDTNCKEIFLDVACILKGWKEDEAIRVLESCGFHAIRGLSVLEKKSLITISRDGRLEMHDKIEEMGQYIVRREHEEPNNHSRLWINEEIEDVLVSDQGTNEAIRCIKLITTRLNPEIIKKGFGNMKKLRFLQVEYYVYQDWCNSNWKFDEVCEYFPNALRCLSWEGYPFGSLPKLFQANNLVELNMHNSKIVQLWEGEDRKVLNKLRFLDLSSSNLKNLDLGQTPNLETLDLQRCSDLEELHMSGECSKLISLKVTHPKLRTLDLRGAPNLEELNLDECVDLVELHILGEVLKLKSIKIKGSKLRTLDLRGTPNLEELNLDECVDLVELHILGEVLKLKSIKIKGSKLRTLDLRGTPNLEELNLDECVDLVELHILGEVLKLKSIKIKGSKLRTLDLRGTPNLEELNLDECVGLVELHLPDECLKLESIVIKGSELRTLDLQRTLNLEYLNLDECFNLVELHMSGECSKLISLKVSRSKLRTLNLRGTLNLEELNLDECVDLVELHLPDECLKLESIKIDSSQLRTLDLRWTPNLEKLTLYKCVDLVEIHIPDECLKLESIKINSSQLRTLDLRGTPNLEYLGLDKCDDLVEIHIPDECLKLRSIKIKGSKLRTLDLRGTPNLEYLNLDKCVDLVELHIPNESLKLESINISGLKLRTLNLRGTPNLQILVVSKCYHLVEVHAHDGCLKRLEFVELSGCLRFKPFWFGKQIEWGEVGCISKLHLIAESLEMCPLHFGNNLPKLRFECFYEEHGSSLIGNVEKLISFGLCACTNLERFSQSICGLRCLTKLTLEGSIPEAPKEFDRLECLEELNLLSTKITHLPDSICKLKHLKCLKVDRCWLLEKLPEDLGRLECLEKLILSECVFLQHIPNSICIMKRLQYFLLPGCPAVEKLPEEIGHLKCLKELNIEGTNIRHLPESIFELKGLRIVGYRWLLQAYGFTSQIQTSEDETFFYVEL